jgi:hypothetical protein
MLMNFLCSAQDSKIDLSNLVVFGGDQVVADIATSLGLTAFSHKAFGELPTAHSKQYARLGARSTVWFHDMS